MAISDLRTKSEVLHDLARLAKSGDQEALTQLLQHPDITHLIFTIACHQVGSADADDVYQEVCLRIALKLFTWQETGKLTNWISRMTVNCCHNVQQQRVQEREKLQGLATLVNLRQEQEPPQTKRIQLEEGLKLVKNALDEMGEPCREMLRLYIFDELDKPAIMQRMACKKTKFHQAWKHCYHELMQKIQNFF